ncbi:MAG TPA: sigma-54 dependent transcriptional regulator [Vicinamibacterales bacterium]|nr:sigma-54 dependent transcriptional regulator [Vicinamibacterales bacterium]
MARILVIDDDTAVRESVSRTLRSAGHAVQTAASGEEGLELARGGAFDVILSDLRMPGISGLDVLARLREAGVDSVFLVMTGFGTIDAAVDAMRLGAVDFVQKPFFRDEILMRVKAAADRRQLARQVGLLQRQIPRAPGLEALIGDSTAMRRVKEVIRRAAAAAGTVLITGETGTGKELAARAIHAHSTRAAAPFVPLNCAAVSESLLENELFGHARGAFTGASAARAGLIEHASGGTLFLDEIGTMAPGLQAKLLRALESGEVRRIGENQTRRVDVRFVAATNVDLKAAVERGDFRGDLYYRLDVLRVHLPPLRDRREDIRPLVEHFLAMYGAAAGIRGCTEAAWAALLAYDFPGNVRELEHLVQRAVAVAPGEQIDTADLPAELLAPPAPPLPPGGSVVAARGRAEREMIVAALDRCGGEISAAARELNVSRTTMWRLMKKHRIPGSLA